MKDDKPNCNGPHDTSGPPDPVFYFTQPLIKCAEPVINFLVKCLKPFIYLIKAVLCPCLIPVFWRRACRVRQRRNLTWGGIVHLIKGQPFPHIFVVATPVVYDRKNDDAYFVVTVKLDLFVYLLGGHFCCNKPLAVLPNNISIVIILFAKYVEDFCLGFWAVRLRTDDECWGGPAFLLHSDGNGGLLTGGRWRLVGHQFPVH